MVYIKRLTIQGFKSFGARRHSISLSKGFVVITGPNGGGKSNVIDAIKFALGELSTQSLRVSKLSELVNESRSGRRAGYARVSLVLDNSDKGVPINDEEIVITRKITPAGESVYQLNGRNVSRMELLTLLSAANVKSSGFNIITQGAVLGIAEMSSDELRRMIEEVAGTAEYDKRRAETISQLELAERNIAVAKAGASEVKQRVRQLEKEKTQLRRRELVERELSRLRAEKLSRELSSIESERGRLLEEEREIMEQKRENEEAVAAISEERAKLEGLLAASESELSEIEGLASERAAKSDSLRAELERLRTIIRSYGMRYAGIKRKIIDINASLPALRTTRSKCEEELERLLKERRELEAEVEYLGRMLGKLREERGRVESRLRELEEARAILNRRREERRNEILRVAKEVEAKVGRAEALKEEVRLNEAKEASIAREVEELRGVAKDLKDRLGGLRSKKKTLESSRDSKLEELTRVKKSISVLEEVTVELERLISEAEAKVEGDLELSKTASREIARELGSSVVGVLSDLFEPPRGLEAVFNLLLRERAHSLVVRSDSIALRLTRIAAELGVPLCVISIEGKPRCWRDGCLACMAEAVSEEALDALHIALGPIKLSRGEDGPVRWVSEEGVLAEGNGLYESLGRTSSKQLLIDEARELRASARLVKRRLDELRKKESSLIEEIDRLNFDLSKIEGEELRLSGEVRVVNERIERLISEREELRERTSSMLKGIESIELSVIELKGRIEEMSKDLEVVGEEPRDLEELIRRLEEVRSELDSIEEQHSYKVANLRALSERVSKLYEEIREIESEIRGSVTRIDRLGAEASTEKERIKAYAQDYLEISSRRREALREVSELKDKLSYLRAKRDEIKGRINEASVEIERRRKLIEELNSRLQSLRLSLLELNMRASNVKERLSSMGAGPGGELQMLSLEAKDEVMRRLEGELESMGLVNQLAAMQYGEIIGNYKVRASRIQELERERQELLKLIEIIDSEKLEVFTSTMKKVSEGFGYFFNKLTGGEGWLELSDPERPLESGVEMIVRFVDKPARSSRSVSGGEKSVAAISLLMALQGLTPADFYIFDEVDAHMDVAYTRNLALLFKEISSRTQIIAVSLKDIMAEHADQLIGVYSQMGESRIVVTKLGEELEKAAA